MYFFGLAFDAFCNNPHHQLLLEKAPIQHHKRPKTYQSAVFIMVNTTIHLSPFQPAAISFAFDLVRVTFCNLNLKPLADLVHHNPLGMLSRHRLLQRRGPQVPSPLPRAPPCRSPVNFAPTPHSSSPFPIFQAILSSLVERQHSVWLRWEPEISRASVAPDILRFSLSLLSPFPPSPPLCLTLPGVFVAVLSSVQALAIAIFASIFPPEIPINFVVTKLGGLNDPMQVSASSRQEHH
jgi:hypothetical protein